MLHTVLGPIESIATMANFSAVTARTATIINGYSWTGVPMQSGRIRGHLDSPNGREGASHEPDVPYSSAGKVAHSTDARRDDHRFSVVISGVRWTGEPAVSPGPSGWPSPLGAEQPSDCGRPAAFSGGRPSATGRRLRRRRVTAALRTCQAYSSTTSQSLQRMASSGAWISSSSWAIVLRTSARV